MTSYGSYNEIKKPIIADSVIISVSNCSFSFISGFAVWLVVGYLEKLGKLDENQIAGASLAFITYPTAIDTMANSNIWAIILGLTLFMLGIDSSFSAIEATSTVICDTAWKGKAPRMFIAFLLCLFGLIGSFPFCFNWGFVLFDVVDHYLCAYLLNMIGVLQAFGCGWFFDAAETMKKSEGHRQAILTLGFSYWIPLVTIITIAQCVDQGLAGFLIFFFVFCISAVISYKQSGLCLKAWYHEIMMCGVRRIAYACSQMSRKETEKTKVMWWEPYFAFYWGILVKYVNPCLLYAIIVSITRTDLGKNYGGYGSSWLVIGWAIPILGIVMFVLATIFFGEPDDALNYDEFILEEEKRGGEQSIELGSAWRAASKNVESGNVQTDM